MEAPRRTKGQQGRRKAKALVIATKPEEEATSRKTGDSDRLQSKEKRKILEGGLYRMKRG